MAKPTRALPQAKRDHLRAYLSALMEELFECGLIKPTDSVSTALVTIRRHVFDEVARDVSGLLEEAAPVLVERGVGVAGRALGRLLFGGRF